MPHRLYSNENFPREAVEHLRSLGHDVVTIMDDGLANQGTPDSVLFNRAVALQRTILTLNRRDFIRLHQGHHEHAGIVVCTVDLDSEALAQRIHQQIDGLPTLQGQLIAVQRPPHP